MDTSKKKRAQTKKKKKKEHKNKTLKLELVKKKKNGRSPCAHMGSKPREKKSGSYHLFPLSLSQSNAIQKNFPPHLHSFFFSPFAQKSTLPNTPLGNWVMQETWLSYIKFHVFCATMEVANLAFFIF